MSVQKMPWFRMYTDFLNDPKMISLAFEDQRHFMGVLALKSDGALDQDCSDDLLDRIVAQRLWIDHAVIREVKKRLVAAGLIDNDWQPLAWDRRQMRSDVDPTNAERQRRHRQKKKEADQPEQGPEADQSNEENRNALRNVPVTPLDTDTEEDSNKALSSKPDSSLDIARRTIDYLNEKTGSHFKHTNTHLRAIVARLKEGATEDELRQVVDRKSAEWLNDSSMRQYLRPATLFTPKNYDNYVGQLNQPLPTSMPASKGKALHNGFSKQNYQAGVGADGSF